MRGTVRACVVIWLLVLAWLTSARTVVFQSNLALWTDASQKAPTKPRPTLNYGRELELAGDVVRAEAFYREVIAQVWDPRRPPYARLSGQAAAETNIAHLRLKAGKGASALEILTFTLSYWPIYPYAKWNRGTIYWDLGLCEEARKDFEAALQLDPALTVPPTPCVQKEGFE